MMNSPTFHTSGFRRRTLMSLKRVIDTVSLIDLNHSTERLDVVRLAASADVNCSDFTVNADG